MSKQSPKSPVQLAVAAALSLTALGAAAQSNANVYGLIDLSIANAKAPGGESKTTMDSGKMTTSYYGFGGKEDLGGGLAAQFRIEGFFQADTGTEGRFTGDATWARTSSVGFSHADYGSLNFGRNSTQLFISTLSFNALGDSFGYSPSIRHYFTSGTVSGDTGWNDSIFYSSPSFGGFRFGLATALETGSAATDGENWGLNLGYASGPLSAAVVYQDVKKDGATAAVDNTTTTQLNGAYDFGVAKAYLQYGTVDNDTTGNDYDIVGAGVRVPFGAGAAVAQYGQIDAKNTADRKTFTAGYIHALSKRSELYAVYMKDKIDGLSSGRAYAVGVRHKF